MRVNADQAVCVGSGNCVFADPDVFDQDETEGHVLLLRADVPAGHESKVREAVRFCPSGAISTQES